MTFPLDISRSLEPEEMEDIMHHPAVIAAAARVLQQPELGFRVVDATENIFSALEGFDPLTALLAALDTVGVLAANLEHEAERVESKKRFRVLLGGVGIVR